MGTPDNKNAARLSALDIYVLSSALLYLASVVLGSMVLPESLLWGVHHLRYVGAYLFLHVVCVALGVTAFVYREKAANFVSGTVLASRKNALIGMAVVTAAFVVLFVVFRAKTTFLGDGSILLGSVPRVHFRPSDLVDHYLHSAFYRRFLQPRNAPLLDTYTVLSAVAGAVFVVAAMLFARAVTSRGEDLLWVVAFLTTAGYMVHFFGYVESYAFLYASLMFYLAAGVLALKGRWPLWPATVLCCCCLLFHQTAVLLLPSLAFFYFTRLKDSKHRVAKLALQICIAVAVVGATVGIFFSLGFKSSDYLAMLQERSGEDGSLLLTPWGGKYPVLSSYHMVDFLNLLLLTSPAAFILVPVVALRRAILRDTTALFLLCAFVPYFGFFFLMDPKIEMFRDWDLFSAPAFTAAALAAYCLVNLPGLKVRAGLRALLVGVMAFNTISWVFVNSNEEASAMRFETLVNRPNRRARGYLHGHNYQQLSDFYGARGDQDKRRGFLRLAAEVSDHPRRFYALAATYAMMKQYDSAAYAFGKAAEFNPNFFEAHLNLGYLYYNRKRYDLAAAELEKALELRPRSTNASEVLGRSYLNAGKLDKAEEFCKSTLERNPRNGGAYYVLSMVKSRQGSHKEAFGLYQEAVKNGFKDSSPQTAEALRRKAGG